MFGKIICGLLFCASVAAQPIKIVVPFSPGGQVDIIAREVQQTIIAELDRPVIIDYRLGAGSAIGISSVARTKTDEVVLMTIDTTAMASVMLAENINIDEFRYLGRIGSTTTSLAVIKNSNLKNINAWNLLNRPITIGTNGIGGPHHYYTYKLSQSVKIPITAVPYKGIAPAINDLLGGHIDAMWGSTNSLLPYAQAGKIEFVATISTKRLTEIPDGITFGELGYSAVGSPTVWMIVANSTADPKTLQKISELFGKIVKDTQSSLYKNTGLLADPDKYFQARNSLQNRLKQQLEFSEYLKTLK